MGRLGMLVAWITGSLTNIYIALAIIKLIGDCAAEFLCQALGASPTQICIALTFRGEIGLGRFGVSL